MRFSTLLILAAVCVSVLGSGGEPEKKKNKRKLDEMTQGNQKVLHAKPTEHVVKRFRLVNQHGGVSTEGNQPASSQPDELAQSLMQNLNQFTLVDQANDIVYNQASKKLVQLLLEVERITLAAKVSCNRPEYNYEQVLGVTIGNDQISRARAIYRGHAMQLQKFGNHLLTMLNQIQSEFKAPTQPTATITTTTTMDLSGQLATANPVVGVGSL